MFINYIDCACKKKFALLCGFCMVWLLRFCLQHNIIPDAIYWKCMGNWLRNKIEHKLTLIYIRTHTRSLNKRLGDWNNAREERRRRWATTVREKIYVLHVMYISWYILHVRAWAAKLRHLIITQSAHSRRSVLVNRTHVSMCACVCALTASLSVRRQPM